MAAKRETLSAAKRYLIKFLFEELNQTPQQIREHQKLRRENGTKLDLKVNFVFSFFVSFNLLISFQWKVSRIVFNRLLTVRQTIKRWIERNRLTGDVKPKPKTGRPRALSKEAEEKLVKRIEGNSQMSYRVVAEAEGLVCSRRTVNHYAIRNKFSE